MIYNELLKAMENDGIRYVVVGGVAVILHGFVRASMDLDIVISLDSKNTHQFIDLVSRLGYRSKAPVPLSDFADPAKRKEWLESKGMIVFSLHHAKRYEELVDVFINDVVPFEELFGRRVKIALSECSVNIASRQDLKTMKRIAGRPQDLEDIKALDELDRRDSL
jgi:hypothetical protein